MYPAISIDSKAFKMLKTSRPSTSSTSTYTLPPPSLPGSNQNNSETEEFLQKHYMKVQKSLLDAVDKQVDEIRQISKEKEHLLKIANTDKELLGVELYGTKVHVGRLNNSLAKLNEKVNQTDLSEKLAYAEVVAVEKEISTVKKFSKDVSAKLTEKSSKLEEAEVKMEQLREINIAYSSDLKIQGRINSKLRKELEISEQKRKDLHSTLDNENRTFEASLAEKKGLIETLKNQKVETYRSQDAIDRMNREINELNEMNKTYKKNWEDSLAAMEKRDHTLQAVQSSQEEVKSKLLSTENQLRVAKLQNDDYERKFREKELANEAMFITISNLRGQISTLEGKVRETRSGMTESQVAESLYKQELEKVGKSNQIAKDELHRKNMEISELKNNLDKLKDSYDSRMKNDFIMTLAKKEEAVEAIAAAKVQTAKKEHSRDNVTLRQENVQLKIKNHDLSEQVGSNNSLYSNLKSKFEEVSDHYAKLYEEAKQLIYALERKEHDVNYLRSKVMEIDDSVKIRPLQMANFKLEKELTALNVANDRLQSMWIESQKENIKTKDQLQKIKTEYSILQTRIGTDDVIKSKTLDQIEDAKKDGIESKFEAARLYNELRKLQPLVDELRKKNVDLERKLTESRLQMEESNINSNCSSHMLKTEIRRLYQDKQSVVKARLVDDRSNSALERKYILAKENWEKLKMERLDLQKKNFELKCRAEDMERRYHEIKNQYQHFAEVARRNAVDLARGNSGHVKRPVWASFASTPGQLSLKGTERVPSANSQYRSSVDEAEGLGEIPDFDAWRLKLASLKTERDYLKNENDLMRRRLEDIVAKKSHLEKSLHDSSQKFKLNENTLKITQAQFSDITIKHQRATKLAAFIEWQLKELKPNSRIDYQLVGNVEPSTQLIAALMVQDIPEKIAAGSIRDDKKSNALTLE